MKIGRNSPCPCGSGKKYKRCCAERPQPGFDFKKIVGISVDPEEQQIMYVTNDILINQLRRDAPKIAESFDRLHDADLREMSNLLGSATFLLTGGFKEVCQKNDELRITCAQLLFNAINSFIGATSLLRDGFYLQTSIMVRSILETLATVMHLLMTSADLERFKRNELELKTVIPSAKTIIPPFGHMYGMFSENFVHISTLHGKLHPIGPYEETSEPLSANLTFLRFSIWLTYVVAELLFVDMIEGGKYWERIEPGKVEWRPSKETVEWQDKFLHANPPKAEKRV
jgi:hypothetical protein